MIKMELKDIIRNARKKKGLTQRALAGLMHVTYQNIQLWERGK
jgi:transcriptional regulator with XRE-family HTH domain